MKKLLLFLMLIPILSLAQDDDFFLTTNSKQIETFRANGDQVNVEGSPTTLFTKENNEILGTKYISNNWNNGYLVLDNSTLAYQDEINYDLLDRSLIVKSKNLGVYKVTDNRVTGFIISAKNSFKRTYYKKLDFSKFESQAASTRYYEVISNSKNTNYLIKDTHKYIFDPTNTTFKPLKRVEKEYKERVNYYIKNKSGKYVKTKLNKKAILKVLNDKNSEIKIFISNKKLNLSNELDVVKVLDYYHTL